VAAENSDGDDITAEIFEMTNHPGADVKMLKDGEIFEEIQLKATDDPALIERHFDKYPGIPVAATSEVAKNNPDVTSSGYSDAELEDNLNDAFNDLTENNPISDAEDLVAPVGLASAALQAGEVLRGNKTIEQASGQALQDMGVAVTSSLLIDLMFST